MTTCRRCLVVLLVFVTAFIGALPTPCQAGPVPSGAGAQTHSRTVDLGRIETLLDDPTVREGLRQAGTNAAQLRHLLPRMNDYDVHLLAEKMGQVKTGGIGIIEILVIVLLVILIIYLVR